VVRSQIDTRSSSTLIFCSTTASSIWFLTITLFPPLPDPEDSQHRCSTAIFPRHRGRFLWFGGFLVNFGWFLYCYSKEWPVARSAKGAFFPRPPFETRPYPSLSLVFLAHATSTRIFGKDPVPGDSGGDCTSVPHALHRPPPARGTGPFGLLPCIRLNSRIH